MRNCFVPKCDSVCKDNPRRMMFMAPKDHEMFEKWKEVLPKKREFKRIDKVCERHFTKEDIMTTFDHVINGELLQMERGRPRLKREAVPSLHLKVDPLILVKVPGKRSSGAKISTRKILRKENQQPKSEKDAEVTSSTPKKDIENRKEEEKSSPQISFEITTANSLEHFESLFDDVFEVTLPSMLWGVHREPEREFIAFTYFDMNNMQSTKSVVLNNSGLLKIIWNGKVVSEQSLCDEINPEFMSNILNEIDEAKFCSQSTKNKHCELFVPEGSEYCVACS